MVYCKRYIAVGFGRSYIFLDEAKRSLIRESPDCPTQSGEKGTNFPALPALPAYPKIVHLAQKFIGSNYPFNSS